MVRLAVWTDQWRIEHRDVDKWSAARLRPSSETDSTCSVSRNVEYRVSVQRYLRRCAVRIQREDHRRASAGERTFSSDVVGREHRGSPNASTNQRKDFSQRCVVLAHIERGEHDPFGALMSTEPLHPLIDARGSKDVIVLLNGLEVAVGVLGVSMTRKDDGLVGE